VTTPTRHNVIPIFHLCYSSRGSLRLQNCRLNRISG